ncbi:flagellar hook-associated protein 2 [Kineococcus radiotolerans]|uniref:Flagellar hook-associated protein 2 n=1 Tax=Kineococcus radiotolerans TaxID=131568 RepID=A0A7W4TIV3_KINRA|nr:flagellar filament capping protein FliD [Kineococcus radiotolerans]MBB2899678.1 flagellar hook-associated protein 2 [Kineococcus radiotolerans]
MASISSAVDGLVSGLDTSSIISSLIAVDGSAQTRMKSSVSSAQLKVTAYQSVNTKVAALQTAAEALQKAATWTPVKATSSSDAVTVTAGSTAKAASLDVTVAETAAARTVVTDPFTVTPNGDLRATLGFPVDVVRSDGTYVTIKPNAGSLDDILGAINDAANSGIKAVAIRVGTDQYRLQITSTKTGEGAGDFRILDHGGRADSTGNLTVENWNPVTKLGGINDRSGTTATATARDAKVYLGPGTSVPVTSSTNTFSELLPGVTVTVGKVSATPATVSVAPDSSAVAASVQALVDAANAALKDIALQSRSGSVGTDGKITGGGLLRGDSTLRALRSQVLEAVTSAVGNPSTSAATFGLQSTREGELTFDKAKFLDAYAKDPASIQGFVASKSLPALPNPGNANPAPVRPEGLAERLARVAKGASDSVSGTISSAIAGQSSSISDLNKRISDWDTRLAAKKVQYQKYYGALEVSLGKLKSQSTWLSGQLAGLG